MTTMDRRGFWKMLTAAVAAIGIGRSVQAETKYVSQTTGWRITAAGEAVAKEIVYGVEFREGTPFK